MKKKEDRPWKWIYPVILLLAAVITTLLVLYPRIINPQFNKSGLDNYVTVTKVIDGDTVTAEGNKTIRLLSIDTPEIGQACSEEAKNRLTDLVLNHQARLESDNQDKDIYGRYLRFLIVDGENINLLLVKEGLAQVYLPAENQKYREDLVMTEDEAKQNKTGCLWRKANP